MRSFALLFHAGNPTFVTAINNGGVMSHSGYCMRCRAHREMKDVVNLSMKNGRNAVKGACNTCGAGMYKILPAEEKKTKA